MPLTSNRIRIHQWHCRVQSQHPALWRDGLLEQATQAIEATLPESLIDSEELWLVRQVHLRFCGLHTHDQGQESGGVFSRELGRAVSLAIAQAIHRGQHGPDVKRYASLAHHLADFAVALIDQASTDAWYFDAIHRQLAEKVTSITNSDQLLDRFVGCFASQWSELSRVLVTQGRLIPVLRRLTPETAERVTNVALAPLSPSQSLAQLRPVFAAALEIWQCLTGQHTSAADLQHAWDAYAASPQPATDWQDTTHLAEAVCQAIRFLQNRLAVKLTSEDIDRLEQNRSLLARLDWLDQEWLVVRLKNFTCKVIGAMDRVALKKESVARAPSRREQGWVLAWQRVEPTLAELAAEGSLSKSAMRLAASGLVLEQLPGQVSDAHLEQFIDRMLTQLQLSQRPSQEAAASSGSLSVADDNQTATDPECVGRSPTSRPSSVLWRSRTSSKIAGARSTSNTNSIASASSHAAGVWLLLRSMHDLRLPAMCRRMEMPGAATEQLVWFFQQLLTTWSDGECSCHDPVVECLLKCILGLDEVPEPLRPTSVDAQRMIEFQLELQTRCSVIGHSHSQTQIQTPTKTQAHSQAQTCDTRAREDDHAALLGQVIQATSQCIVNHWGQQLKGLGNSSVDFLLSKCLRRAGTVQVRERRMDVWLEAAPFDAALQVSGLLDPIDYFAGTKITKIIYYTRATESGGRV